MKFSDIKGERVFDVIADVIDPIVNIATDNVAAEIFKRKELPDGMEPWEFFLTRIKGSLPSLLKSHKDDFVTIMSTLKGVTKDEYLSGMTLATLLSDIVELVTDPEFTSFFG